MVRLEYSFSGDAFADGSGGDKFLIDLSEDLSALYGRLIRQGQVFRIRQIDARIYNPNTTLQDEVMAVSGKYIYFHPTGARKGAWKNAYRATQEARKRIGFKTHTGNYDFRVGFSDGYATDVGVAPLFNQQGVKYNAWLDAEDEPLMLINSNDEQSIFGVYNTMMDQLPAPVTPSYSGFGSPYQKDADALADVLDFVANDTSGGYFVKGQAALDAQTAPFQCSFTSIYASSVGETSDANSVTNPSHLEGPLDVLCGLIGVYIDTTTIDDSLSQTQDWGLQISVDVEEWSPILKSKKRRR